MDEKKKAAEKYILPPNIQDFGLCIEEINPKDFLEQCFIHMEQSSGKRAVSVKNKQSRRKEKLLVKKQKINFAKADE